MSSGGSVTNWIEQMRSGNRAAAQQLWERYFPRLVGLARQKLHGLPRRAADEEDVALSAFDSFCRNAEAGRFPCLDDRDDLWRLLFTITARKVIDLRRRETRKKRGGGAVAGESELDALLGDGGTAGIGQVVGIEPAPELAAQMAEEFQCLLDMLPDEELRATALAKLEGYTNAEIAARHGCSAPTVKRRLSLIRAIWKEQLPS
jgi:RNA polymerase sigma factor (sigma-70 family)